MSTEHETKNCESEFNIYWIYRVFHHAINCLWIASTEFEVDSGTLSFRLCL